MKIKTMGLLSLLLQAEISQNHVMQHQPGTFTKLRKNDPDGLNVYWTVGSDRNRRSEMSNLDNDYDDGRSYSEVSKRNESVIMQKYPTNSGLTEDQVYSLCANTILNSTVAKICSRYLISKPVPSYIYLCLCSCSYLQ